MKLDDLLARDLAPHPEDDALASRVVQSLAAHPLPPQRQPLLSRWWPSALLNVDFTPAWPRVAALASAACFGVAIGLFGLDAGLLETRTTATAAITGETDVASLVFDAEPLTGVRP